MEKFKPFTNAEYAAGMLGSIGGFAILFVPLAIDGASREKSGQELQAPLRQIWNIQDLKANTDSVAKPHRPAVEQFLTDQAQTRHQQIQAIKADMPPRPDISAELIKVGGGTSLTALVLTMLTCSVRYRLHRVRIKKNVEKGIEEFEDLLKNR